MTTESQPRLKITYATLRADNEDLQVAYEAGLERAKARLGQSHRNFIDGRERDGEGTFEVRSPIDTDIVRVQYLDFLRADGTGATGPAVRDT